MFKNKKNGKLAQDDIKAQEAKLKSFLSKDLGDKIADAAQNIVDSSFEKEQYQGKPGQSKWKSRANDSESANPRNQRRALLVKTGQTQASVVARNKGRGEVSISSDREIKNWNLAQIHNEGLKPQSKRQFMPIPGEESPILSKIIEDHVDKIFTDIFN